VPGSFIPPYDADAVNVGLASMYVGAWDPATPLELPADTVELGEAWPTGWTPLGATDSGLEFAFSRKTNDITIEEQIVAVDTNTDSLTFEMNVTLAQDTLQTMKLAYGGGKVTDIAPTATTPGIRTLTIATDLDTLSFGFEVQNEFGFWRRYFVPKVKSVANVKTTFSRSKDKRMYAVTFQSLVAPEDVVVREKTAEPSAA
jgi:hypothetical protein